MIFFFFIFNFLFSPHSMKHCNKEQEKCSFSFCVGENQGQVSEHLSCLGGTACSCWHVWMVIQWSPLLPKHTDNSNCVWGLDLCVAEKTPKALSHTITNRMKKNARPVSTSGFFHSDPWTDQVFISNIYFFYLKKETSSVTYQFANFQGATHKVHKHLITGCSIL